MRVMGHAALLSLFMLIVFFFAPLLSDFPFGSIIVLGVVALVMVGYVVWPRLFFRGNEEEDFIASQTFLPAYRPPILSRAGSALLAIVLAVAVKSLSFETSVVAGTGMEPSFREGTFVVVSKFSYGFSAQSFPLVPPLFDGRFFRSDPRRGDVVLFHHPRTGSRSIGRIVGFGGEQIQVVEGVLLIDGRPVQRIEVELPERLKIQVPKSSVWKETLPNGVTHDTLDLLSNSFYDNTPIYKVPQSYFFMMMDNRDNADDSRSLRSTGYIPAESLIGPVVFNQHR